MVKFHNPTFKFEAASKPPDELLKDILQFILSKGGKVKETEIINYLNENAVGATVYEDTTIKRAISLGIIKGTLLTDTADSFFVPEHFNND